MLWTILNKACAGLIVGVLVFFVLLIVLVISLFVLVISLFYLAINSVIVTTLFMLLRSKSEIVRKLAAQALGINRDFSCEKDLATALQHETSSQVRIAIIKSLVILSRKLLEAAKDAAKDARKRPREHPGALPFDLGPGPEHYLKAIREYIVPGLARSLRSTDRHERDTAFSALKQIGTPEALAAIEQALNSAPSDVVQFTAYHPRDVHASAKHSLYVYAHIAHELTEVEDDVRKVTSQLSGEPQTPRSAKQAAQLKIGTHLTIIPECREIDFDPISMTKTWNGSWLRFTFDFRPHRSLVDEAFLVRVSIQVHGVEVAHLKLPIDVIDDVSPLVSDGNTGNPLATAKIRCRQISQMYQSIFVSYSREDKEVVDTYHLVQTAIGNEVFVDSYSIRTGENWRVALARAIDKADIFQLFWSKNSAVSDNVRDEWEYAINDKCPEDRGLNFIRPVYWEETLYPPPSELSHLNFRFVPLKSHDKSSRGRLLTSSGT